MSAKTTGWLRETELVPKTQGIVAAIKQTRFALDLATKTAADSRGEPVHLTPTEWRLLETLLRRPGRLVSGRELLAQMRGSPQHTDPSYLRIYVAQLRRKIEPDPAHPRFIVTEPGMGYRYQPAASDGA